MFDVVVVPLFACITLFLLPNRLAALSTRLLFRMKTLTISLLVGTSAGVHDMFDFYLLEAYMMCPMQSAAMIACCSPAVIS